MNNSFKPGEIWLDTDGKPIQAHGGGIIFHNGIYYWYGENKDAENISDIFGSPTRVNVIGVSCYSSKDLYNWKNESIVLEAVKDNPEHDLHTSKILERPKVIYNDRTRKFVMWFHADSADYTYAGTGVAVSNKPEGPFSYIGSFRPNGCDSRDMTVFKDNDQKAYLIYSTGLNSRVHITELTEDYLGVKNEYTSHFVMPNAHESREAPAIFKNNGRYHLVTSGCSGWDYNAAEYAAAESVKGPWTVLGNPCRGKDREKTFYAQSTFIFPVEGRENAYIFMADRWFKDNLRDSRYIWLPVKFDGGNIVMEWVDEWDLSVFEGMS